jgi:hypothetical protein
LKPALPGELHVVSEIMEIIPSRSKPYRGIVVLRSETRDQRGEVVQVLTSELVVPANRHRDLSGTRWTAINQQLPLPFAGVDWAMVRQFELPSVHNRSLWLRL